MFVTYGPSKISSSVQCIHGPMQCLQNALAYIALAINYKQKILMKFTSVVDSINILCL